jgi:predicted Fe-Mo cluster-binding NifX family protein
MAGMKTIALSIFRNRISSRLDAADEILILTLENNQVKNSDTIRIIPGSPLDKIQQIIELNPDVLICGGLTQLCNRKLLNTKITVVPWTKGNAEDVFKQFLDGKLTESVTVANY